MNSPIHRINAAFGVSSAFVPYRPDYDTLLGMMITKYPTFIFNNSRSYTLKQDIGHIFTAKSYGQYLVAYVFKYTTETNVRMDIISKSNGFDTYATITLSTDNSNTITLTSKSSNTWFVTNMISLG